MLFTWQNTQRRLIAFIIVIFVRMHNMRTFYSHVYVDCLLCVNSSVPTELGDVTPRADCGCVTSSFCGVH